MKQWAEVLGLSGIGFYIAGMIILGVLGGRWLDGKLSTEPLFIITGLILGIAGAFLGVYRMIRPLIDKYRNGEG